MKRWSKAGPKFGCPLGRHMRHHLISLGGSRQNSKPLFSLSGRKLPAQNRNLWSISQQNEKSLAPALLSFLLGPLEQPQPHKLNGSGPCIILWDYFAFWKCHEIQVSRAPWGILVPGCIVCTAPTMPDTTELPWWSQETSKPLWSSSMGLPDHSAEHEHPSLAQTAEKREGISICAQMGHSLNSQPGLEVQQLQKQNGRREENPHKARFGFATPPSLPSQWSDARGA